MAFGDMWWVKHELTGKPPPGVSVTFGLMDLRLQAS
jgi:hypothetical protein